MASKSQLREALIATAEPMELLNPNFKGMIYGESGVGKTVAAMEIAQAIRKFKGGEILYVDAAEGWVSLQNHKHLKESVTRLRYEGKSQLDLIAELWKEGDEWARKFQVIIFDEISVMATKDLDIVLEASVRTDRSKDPDVPTWPDMNANTQRMRKTSDAFLELDLDQIYLSHIREDEDKMRGYRVTRPEFMPKLSTTIRKGLHFVGYMTADIKQSGGKVEYVRQMQVHPTKTIVAKSRIGGLGVQTTTEKFIPILTEWMNGNVSTIDEQEVIDDSEIPVVIESADPGIVVE